MYRGRPVQARGRAVLRTMFESVSDGLFVLECLPPEPERGSPQPRCRFLVGNPAFCRMFFLSSRPIEGEEHASNPQNPELC
ncbi:PAS domain-containing protein [Thermostichus sp. OS-CIW-21]|jgi:PAS domain-containing protein